MQTAFRIDRNTLPSLPRPAWEIVAEPVDDGDIRISVMGSEGTRGRVFEIARADATMMIRNIEADFAIVDMFPSGDAAWSAASAKVARMIVEHFAS